MRLLPARVGAKRNVYVCRHFTGWLQKKGSKGIGRKGGKGWSWRWFIYRPKEHQLLYYEKDGPKMELKGTIEMKDAKRVYVLDNKDQDKARQSFGVELPKRTYLLQAGDRKQMSKWVDFLSAFVVCRAPVRNRTFARPTFDLPCAAAVRLRSLNP